MIIKVCGMREQENIKEVEALGIDLMGFICFPASSRYVEGCPQYMPECQRVGVFVKASEEFILEKQKLLSLNYIQLHGGESPEFCVSLRKQLPESVKIIKVFSISAKEDFDCVEKFNNVADLFLFDTKCKGYGGSGKKFDWTLFEHYKSDKKFILSGGISPDDIDEIRQFNHPQMLGIDLNSKFEIQPAIKDVDKLRQFVANLKR